MTDIELLRAVNQDVWHPFRTAYGALDAPAYLDLFTRDLIRAGGPTRTVETWADQEAAVADWFALLRRNGDRAEIDFRFTERLAGPAAVSERGAFRITLTPAGGERRVIHARFHTFSRKQDFQWRIAVDYDSTENGTVTAADFENGREIDDVQAFAGTLPTGAGPG